MDYRKVIEEQIEQLQAVQVKKMVGPSPDAESVCRIAESILLLCQNIHRVPVKLQ